MSERTRDHVAVLLGTVFLIAGAIFLVAQLVGVQVVALGWPLLVIGPGVALIAAAYSVPAGRGIGYLAVPGVIVLVTGAVLEIQTITGDWQSWSYAWPLIAPGGVGLGLVLAGLRERSRGVRVVGAAMLIAGAVLFVVAEWFFVRVADVGGPGLGTAFGLVMPALVITLGSWLIVRGLRRGR